MRPLLLLAALLALAAPARAEIDIARATVRSPGNVIVDVARRRAALKRYGRAALKRICEAELFGPRDRIVPIRDPATVFAAERDSRMEPFTFLVMELGGEHLAFDDDRAGRAVAANLMRWARAGAMTRWEDRHPNTYAAVDRVLLPTIVAFSLVRDRMGASERRAVRGWLGRVVTLHDGPRRCRSCDEDTDRSLRAAVNMAWGALTGDHARFRKGIARYRRALGQIGPDGRLAIESQHKDAALASSNAAIAALVAIAEMAAVQGLDLYAERRGAADIHRAIGFLLDGIGRIGPDGRIRPGVPYKAFPRRHQRAGFLYPRANGRHSMAWIEAYLARFPGHPNARRLKAMLAAKTIIGREMLIDELAGGNATCLFGGPAPLG